MDYDRNTTFTNMYLGTEIRFDGVAEILRNLAVRLTHRPAANRHPIAA